MRAARFNGRKLRQGEDGHAIAPRFWRELPYPEWGSFKNKTPSGSSRRAFNKTNLKLNITKTPSPHGHGRATVGKNVAMARFNRGADSFDQTTAKFTAHPEWKDK
jgi:hypothetical protein